MKQRERLTAFHILLLCLGAVLFTGFIVFAVSFLRTSKHSRDLAYSFETLDALIRSQNYEEARRMIENMRPPDYRGDWLRLLKRCRVLSLSAGKTELFSSMALRAANAYPDNEEITAIAVLALTDAGKVDEAAGLAGKKLESREYRSVKAEAFLRGGLVPEGEPEDELIYAVLPESRNPQAYLEAAEMSWETGFYLDAALLLLEAGREEEALKILYRPEVGTAHPYVAALASYDAGKFDESDRYWELLEPGLKMRPLSLQLRADSFLRQRRYEDSENIYEIFLQNYPAYSPVAYLNGYFFRHRRAPWSGISLLEKGLEFFPDNFPLVLNYAKALTAVRRKDEGLARLERFDASAAEKAEADVLRLVAERENLPLRRFVSELWILHNAFPDIPDIPALLRWHLFSLADFPAIRDLLGETAPERFSFSYLAALDFADKNFPAARETLSRQTENFPDCPEGFYNLGIVYLALKNPAGAFDAFEQAAARADYAETGGFGERNALKTMDTLISLGRFPEAHKRIREFLERNPEHPEALRKLKKLEAGGE
jgi:outer membrane protein assembly factor BamD (BamD/ComL family)